MNVRLTNEKEEEDGEVFLGRITEAYEVLLCKLEKKLLVPLQIPDPCTLVS
jgi:hypothetical protein